MSNKNLSTVTTDLIESYGNTARNMIQAYRVGNQRAAHFVDQRWEKALQQSASQLRAEVRKNALAAQKTISGMYVKGIDVTSNGADVMVSKAVELAGKGVQQVAANASAFEKRTGVATLNSLAKATVPAAIVVSNLAGKLEQRSGSLANTVGGKSATVKVAAVKRSAARTATKVKRTTTRRAAAVKSAVTKSATRKSPVTTKRATRKTAVRKTAAPKATAPVTSAAA
jgi:hypothetical protein